jgi:hypothetical protein
MRTLIDISIKGLEERVIVICSYYSISNPREHEEFSKWHGKI